MSNTAATTNTTTYELIVTRLPDAELTSRYEVLIYRMVWAGVCGPFTESEIVNGSYVDYADTWGFRIDGFPTVKGDTATFALALK